MNEIFTIHNIGVTIGGMIIGYLLCKYKNRPQKGLLEPDFPSKEGSGDALSNKGESE